MLTVPRYAIQHLDAGHDVNGNPRRAFVVHDLTQETPPRAFDEGYFGRYVLPAEVLDDSTDLGAVKVSPKVYRATLRDHPA